MRVDEMSQGMRVEIIGHEELSKDERHGVIKELSDDPTLPECCVVLFDDGVEDIMTARILKMEQS
jgi:hypothetical protein